MKTYEIVKLFDGYAVRETPKKGIFGKFRKSSYCHYFDVPVDVDEDELDIFGPGHTWSSDNPQFVKKYCIFKSISEAEAFIERLQTDATDCENPKVVKTVQV